MKISKYQKTRSISSDNNAFRFTAYVKHLAEYEIKKKSAYFTCPILLKLWASNGIQNYFQVVTGSEPEVQSKICQYTKFW